MVLDRKTNFFPRKKIVCFGREKTQTRAATKGGGIGVRFNSRPNCPATGSVWQSNQAQIQPKLEMGPMRVEWGQVGPSGAGAEKGLGSQGLEGRGVGGWGREGAGRQGLNGADEGH